MRKRYARHNAVAEFADEARALRALEALHGSGFEKYETSLLTPTQEKRPGAKRPTTVKPRVSSGLGWGLALGTALGTGAGIALVVPVAVAVVAIAGGTWTGSAALIATLAGGGAGATVGALLGIEGAGRKSAMWSMSLTPLIHKVREGISLVGVHADDDARVDEGAGILRKQDAATVHRLEAEESFSPPANYEANLGDNQPSDAADAPGSPVLSGSPTTSG